MAYNGNAKSNASRSRSHSSRSSSAASHSTRSSGSHGHNESSKAASRSSSVGSARNSSGGLGMGGGTFHGGLGGRASYGGGQTAHSAFSHSVGSSFSGGGGHGRSQSDKRATQKAIESHTFSQKAATTDYGFKSPSRVGGLTGSGTLADMWQGAQEMFSSTVTPTGAYEGYGFQQSTYEDTPFDQRSLSEQWQKDKLGAISNVMKNPMVSAGMWATGLGAVSAGIQVASTVKDIAEGDLDMTKGLGKLASTAITSTPLGKGLGELQGVAGAIAGNLDKAGEALAGFAGGKVGSVVGAGIGALTNNPYAAAVSTVAGAWGGAKLAQSAVEEARTGVGGAMQAAAMTSQRTGGVRSGGGGQADRNRSRPIQQTQQQQPQTPVGQLQASGQQAVQTAQQLQSIDPNVLKYIPQGGYNPFVQGVSSYNPYK